VAVCDGGKEQDVLLLVRSSSEVGSSELEVFPYSRKWLNG